MKSLSSSCRMLEQGINVAKTLMKNYIYEQKRYVQFIGILKYYFKQYIKYTFLTRIYIQFSDEKCDQFLTTALAVNLLMH